MHFPLRSLLTFAAVLPLSVGAQTSPQSITVSYDFRAGAQGWSVVFADYPAGQETFYELDAAVAPLPPELGVTGTGLRITGNNHSDDLLMALKRRVGPAEGLVAGRTYWLDFVVDLASNAQTGCVGTGGSPSEGVYIKVGGSPVEPVATAAADGHLRLSVNVGNQSLDGPAATVVGVAANGVPCGSEPPLYRGITRSGRHQFPVTADAGGNVWLLVLSDSAFESTTRLYYRRISVTLTPADTNAATTRLANLSSRAQTGGDAGVLLAGIHLAGSAPRPLLVRAAGPALGGFGVPGFLANPVLELVDAAGRTVAANDDWNDVPNGAALRAAMARTGAFAFAEGSRDAALLATVPPGLYSALVRGAAGGTGVSLVEIYDAGAGNEPAQLMNLSTRAWIAAGDGELFPGLVVTGENPAKFLIRAVGPGLAAFGVEDFLPDPLLQLYAGTEIRAENDRWDALADGALVAAAARAVGAFPLAPGSNDAALFVTLAPGAYSLRISGARSRAGQVLLELYRVP